MRAFWYVIGVLSLAFGVIGIALPVVPTVPFLLLAAWAFSRSSPHLRQKILDHPTYGPPVRAWQERGVVSRMAKLWAILAMSGGVGISVWLGLPTWIIWSQSVICALIGIFLVTRPEP